MKNIAKEIKITGQKEAFLVTDGTGKEIGTVSRYSRNSLWMAYRGVGMGSQVIGGFKSKLVAIAAI